MISDVVLDPLLWEALEAGDAARIDRWLVAEGDRVHAGQVIAQARLLHQTLDVLAPHNGMLENIFVAAGDRFAHGAVLAQVIPL
jgi:pyruvate/2-oxoglutarate dehydrogenase complex dihydrolipoamide acyltransferase (E2) component